MNNHRKRHILSKQDNIVTVKTIQLHESFIPFQKAIDYLKQGYTIKQLLNGITVTLHSVNALTKLPYSYSVIDKFGGLNDELTKLYKEEEKLNIIRERDANLRLTRVGLIVKLNEKSLYKDPIANEIKSIFSSNYNLKQFAY